MSVLQYVGARYVPVFYKNPDGSWDWQTGVSYEPLTIVKYDSNTYISKVQVPSTIGSPNQNPDYWAQTGNYNGFMQELQDEIDALTLSLETLLPVIGGQKKKKVLLISDSYEDWSHWATTCKAYLANAGIDSDISARSGASFSNTENSFTSLYDISPNRGRYTDVLVGGGVNDYGYSDAQRAAGIQSLLTKCLADGARFHFANFGDFWHRSERLQLWNCYNYETDYVQKNGGAVMPYCFGLLHAADEFNSDGIHPTAKGGELIAKHVAGYIISGLSPVIRQVAESTTLLGYIAGDFFHVSVTSIDVQKQVTGQTFSSIGKLSELIPVTNPGNVITSGYCKYVSTASPREFYDCLYYIFADEIRLNVLNKAGAISLDGAIYGVSFTLPKSVI